MLQKKYLLPLMLLVTIAASDRQPVTAAEPEISTDDAWNVLPKYEYGQDLAPLLAIDRAAIQAMVSPEKRSAHAARLAELLVADGTTLAARQFICLQLRQIGTSAEVPVLAKLLAKPETSEMARHALEAISSEESGAVLRGALATLEGKLLVGVINSVAARNDVAAVADLERLSESQDKQVASASLRALGNITDDRAVTFLTDRAEKVGVPTPRELAMPLLRCAEAHEHAGKVELAQAIFERLAGPGQPTGARRAALEGLLRLHDAPTVTTTILGWFAGTDVDRRVIALGHLDALPDDQIDQLLARLTDLPDDNSRLAVIELAASRRGKAILPVVMALAQSDEPALRRAGVRCLGMLGDASVVPLLVDMLSAGDASAEAAQNALSNLPRKEVTSALLDALGNRPEIRVPVIAVLVDLKCYDAIDPLVEIAARPDPAVYGPALDGLRGIADPDKSDIPRLVDLLRKTEPGRHRDEVEKTILIVCEKLPAKADRSTLVLAAVARFDRSRLPTYLPLLGRLGGAQALEKIREAVDDADPEVREAAIRALCNWPNAEVADELLELATHLEGPDGARLKEFRRWSLRAYIRVITLKSDRPESQTLAMLQNAMELATVADDKQLVLERASTVRTMEAVTWLAQYLDDPALAQVACGSIVELAHHRFLRHPNMERFGPILEKVGRVGTDPEIVERAKRYRLGL